MGLGNSEDAVVDDGDGGDYGGGGKSFIASPVSCSICLEVVADNGDRSWAKLQCGHQFHLDCIGSAFNVKGSMQCPNCRKIEKGQWLYANGCRSFPEFSMEDWNRDDDLYDLSYSEMSLGFHWCPYQLGRLPASFEEQEFPSTAYHDLLGQHAVFTEHTGASSTHPCPYIAYSAPIHPSSSNSSGTASDGSNFIGPWNGPSLPSEVPSSYAFPAMDVHYHSWEHHSPPFSTNSNRVGGADQSSVLPIAQRSARLSGTPRSGSYMHPFLVGQSPAARLGSSVHSSMIPPYPGSSARAHDRVQALQAYYQLQPSNSSALRAPIVPSTRRSSSHRGLTPMAPVSSSSDQTGSFYFFPSGTTGRSHQEPENPLLTRFHVWERDRVPTFQPNQMDRELGWGPFHQANGGSDSSIRSGSSRQRHGTERTLSQNQS